MEEYAAQILEKIDPERQIPHRLFRTHCTMINKNIIKNLSRLGRDLKDVIIVDNCSISYRMQPCNGIPITTWIDDKNDQELVQLIPVLELMAKVDDIRDYLRELVIDNEIDFKEAIDMLKGNPKAQDLPLEIPDDYIKEEEEEEESPKKQTSPKRIMSLTFNPTPDTFDESILIQDKDQLICQNCNSKCLPQLPEEMRVQELADNNQQNFSIFEKGYKTK